GGRPPRRPPRGRVGAPVHPRRVRPRQRRLRRPRHGRDVRRHPDAHAHALRLSSPGRHFQAWPLAEGPGCCFFGGGTLILQPLPPSPAPVRVMQEKLTPALAKRLAAYSATAGVALAAAPGAAAQVVYGHFDPEIALDLDTPGPCLWIDFDFDDDGVGDIRLWGYDLVLGDPVFNEINLYPAFGAPLGNSLVGYETFFGLVEGLSRLTSGDAIGPLLNAPQEWWGGRVYAAGYDFGDSEGQFPFVGEEGYAGFRFVGGDGELHYGWLRLAVAEQADVATVAAYAYNATPDTPIAAGARSDALLDGTVNRTDFPAAGGTLAYTFTATNATDEPLPLDLWIAADGPDALTRSH